jgi:selenocysteine lyase/cysteine desulfurase
LLYLRREWVERLHPVGVGWNSVVGSGNFSRLDFRLKPHAGRWESGSLNVAGITALGASLELLLQIGTAAISARILELTDHLCESAMRRGIEVFSSCRGQGVVVNQRAGRLRVSPHCYNSVAELDRLLDLLPPA